MVATAPRGGPPKLHDAQFRKWRGANLTDARASIDDTEFAWLENAVTVGDGQIQIVAKQGASVATLSQGIASLWGLTLNGAPVMIAVGSDGSLTQVTPGGVTTVIAGAGTVTTLAHIAIFRSSPVLIVCPTFGYFSWDGTTFTTISTTLVGTAIAVFEGRVWIANNRTITYSAPNSSTDFTAANGGGSTILTDEAFPGNITALASALEELWIVGDGAIDALANVVATGTSPNVVTSFSITNIVTNVGSHAPNSVIGYFRALAFLAPFGAYALSGVTPQKLSEKLDGMFPALTLTPDAPAAVGVVESLPCLIFLVTYTQAKRPALQLPANGSAAATPLLLCFTQGKWFFASQGALRWITTLIVAGVSQAWATDGTTIYQCFGDTTGAAITYKIVSKLYDFGSSVTEKEIKKVGFEFQATAPVAPTLTIDTERGTAIDAVLGGNTVTLLNAVAAALQLQNVSGQPLNLVTQGLVLSRSNLDISGAYIGFSVTGNDTPYRIQSIALQWKGGRAWRPRQ